MDSGFRKKKKEKLVCLRLFFTEVHDSGNGILNRPRNMARLRYQVYDRVQAFRDFQSETLIIPPIRCTLKFALGISAPILVPQAPDRFNLDQRSLKYIGRQGLVIFWQCAGELRSVHPENHCTFLGSLHRRFSVGSGFVFFNAHI